MKRCILSILCFLSSYILSAQNADNSLQGYYKASSDDTLYSSFNFDGNGKVSIGDMDYGDYFTRNDSLIIYPDKSIFIFKIKKASGFRKKTAPKSITERVLWRLKTKPGF